MQFHVRNPTRMDVNLHIAHGECTHAYVNTPNIASLTVTAEE